MTTYPSFWEAAREESSTYRIFTGQDSQPKWEISETIAINVAVSGRASHGMDGAEYPCRIQDYINAASEVIEAGACGIHVDFANVITPEGLRLDRDMLLVEAYRRVIDPLRDRFGWGFVPNCNILTAPSFDECLAPVREHVTEVVPSAAGHPEAFLVPALRTAVEHGVAIEIAVHDSGEVMLAKRRLFDTGMVGAGASWIILYGMPFDVGRTLASGTWVTGPEDMAAHMLLIVSQIRQVDPEAVIQVCAAARAGLYMTTLATMLGLHVRIGTEDTVWRAPHSDALWESNLEMFEAARAVAHALGRRPATANEYRRLIGLAEKSNGNAVGLGEHEIMSSSGGITA